LAGEGLRVSAGDIEALVLDRLRALLSSRTDVSETFAPLDIVELRHLISRTVEPSAIVAESAEHPNPLR
jgi:hypothetical protein